MQKSIRYTRYPGTRSLSVLLICVLNYGSTLAQLTPDSTKQNTVQTAVPQKDIVDFYHTVFGRKLKRDTLKISKFTKNDFTYTVLPAIGYTLQTRLAMILAGNVTFKTTKQAEQKLSNIYANVAYTQNNQFTVPILTNIWTRNNRFNFVGDMRYMIYPQSTFGLGGNNSLQKDEDAMSFNYLRFYQFVLKEWRRNFYAGLGYMLDFRYDIEEEGYADGRISDFRKYNPQSESVSSGIAMNMLYDNRTNAINPGSGFYSNLIYRFNPTWLGSNSNWQSILIDLRKYFSLSRRNHRVLALWSYNWLILGGNPPYLDLPATSWDTYTNTGRGFIQGRFRSKKMLYQEAEFRTDITRNGLLGAVFFVNLQSFDEWPEGGFKYLQPAGGFGLRIKLNKLSNTNLTIDYGFGQEGSRGLFINVGELF